MSPPSAPPPLSRNLLHAAGSPFGVELSMVGPPAPQLCDWCASSIASLVSRAYHFLAWACKQSPSRTPVPRWWSSAIHRPVDPQLRVSPPRCLANSSAR